MIKTKQELRRIVKNEEEKIFDIYKEKPLFLRKFICWISHNNRYYTFKLQKSYRYFNYYQHKKKYSFSSLYWGRKYGKYSILLNSQINCDDIGEGFLIVHQFVNINKEAVIGKNVTFIGGNCVGAGSYSEKLQRCTPIIGNNVKFGYGSIVIGGVLIADDVVIGAGAIVTKDVTKPGSILIGINQVVGNIFDSNHKR